MSASRRRTKRSTDVPLSTWDVGHQVVRCPTPEVSDCQPTLTVFHTSSLTGLCW